MATKETKLLEGRRALQVFFNRSLKFPGSAIAGMTYLQFEKSVDDLPHITLWREKLGDAILFAGYPFERVRIAMENLADKNKGAALGPKDGNVFVAALVDDSASFSYKASLAGEAVRETVKDVGKFAVGGALLYGIGALVVLYFATARQVRA